MRSTLKPAICFLKPPGPEQHVLRRNPAVVEVQLAPFLAAHEARRLADGKAGRAALDDHRADAAHAGAEPRIDQEHRGVGAEGREHLGAVDDCLAAVDPHGGRKIGRRRARFRLGHAEAHHRAAFEQRRQVFRLERRRGVFGKGADRAEAAGLHDVGAARTGCGDLLDRDHRVHQRAALAAVSLGERDSEQTLPAHQSGDVEGKPRIVGACKRVLLEAGHCEFAHGVGEEFLLVGEVEIHGGLS